MDNELLAEAAIWAIGQIECLPRTDYHNQKLIALADSAQQLVGAEKLADLTAMVESTLGEEIEFFAYEDLFDTPYQELFRVHLIACRSARMVRGIEGSPGTQFALAVGSMRPPEVPTT